LEVVFKSSSKNTNQLYNTHLKSPTNKQEDEMFQHSVSIKSKIEENKEEVYNIELHQEKQTNQTKNILPKFKSTNYNTKLTQNNA
jgi:hypothetical protein